MNTLLLVVHLLMGTDCKVEEPDYSKMDGFYTAVARVPVFFTSQPCVDSASAHVDVFAKPARATKIAEIRWAKSGQPGAHYCLPVVYLPRQSCPRGELPTMELDYEESGLVVVERSGRWVRIRLDEGTGWVLLSDGDEVVPYEDLVMGHLAEMTQEWDGRIYSQPGERARTLSGVKEPSVTVEDCRRVDGKLWLRVRVFAESPCEVHEPRELANGWVRGYSNDRQPTVYYFSRGC